MYVQRNICEVDLPRKCTHDSIQNRQKMYVWHSDLPLKKNS